MLQGLPSAIGRSLRGLRSERGRLAIQRFTPLREEPLLVSSSGFSALGELPRLYTADGPGLSPPLSWSGAPENALSIVLIIEDVDSPSPEPLVHGIAWMIGRPRGEIKMTALNPRSECALPTLGRNSFLRAGYLPPDPPPGHGCHRYVFQVFALDCNPQFTESPGRRAVFEAMRGHVLASGQAEARYERT